MMIQHFGYIAENDELWQFNVYVFVCERESGNETGMTLTATIFKAYRFSGFIAMHFVGVELISLLLQMNNRDEIYTKIVVQWFAVLIL